MDQQTINQQEWNNHDNWVGPVYCRCYFSKKDSRLWVPKSNPALGWTINLGHTYGAFTLIGTLTIVPVALIIFLILGIKMRIVH